jgi:hypothetical protein
MAAPTPATAPSASDKLIAALRPVIEDLLRAQIDQLKTQLNANQTETVILLGSLDEKLIQLQSQIDKKQKPISRAATTAATTVDADGVPVTVPAAAVGKSHRPQNALGYHKHMMATDEVYRKAFMDNSDFAKIIEDDADIQKKKASAKTNAIVTRAWNHICTGISVTASDGRVINRDTVTAMFQAAKAEADAVPEVAPAAIDAAIDAAADDALVDEDDVTPPMTATPVATPAATTPVAPVVTAIAPPAAAPKRSRGKK